MGTIQQAKDLLQRLQSFVETVPALRDSDVGGSDCGTVLHDSLLICAVHVCTGDGQFTQAEQETLQDLLVQTSCDMQYQAAHLAEAPEALESSIEFIQECIHARASQLSAISKYEPADDEFVELTSLCCTIALSADGDFSAGELRRMSALNSRLRAWAQQTPRLFADGNVIEAPVGKLPQAPSEDATGRLIHELDALIGLESVKEEVGSLLNLGRVLAIRRERGLQTPQFSFHLVFSGNPGTGKTTVARILGRLYKAAGLLAGGQFVEVDRSGLVADYVGQTATKTAQVINSAIGGVLFIDEAYALVGTGSDYGSEAIETLLKAMEDHRGQLVVIAAGYTDKMAGFLSSSAGLRSRFAKEITFPDYTAEELLSILKKMVSDNGYEIAEDAEKTAWARVSNLYQNRGEDFGNAREVRRLFEGVLQAQSNRIADDAQLSSSELCKLTAEDFSAAH